MEGEYSHMRAPTCTPTPQLFCRVKTKEIAVMRDSKEIAQLQAHYTLRLWKASHLTKSIRVSFETYFTSHMEVR